MLSPCQQGILFRVAARFLVWAFPVYFVAQTKTRITFKENNERQEQKVSPGGGLNGSQEKQYQFKLKLRASIVFLPWPLFVSFRSRRQSADGKQKGKATLARRAHTHDTKALRGKENCGSVAVWQCGGVAVWQCGGWNRKTFKYLNVLSSRREKVRIMRRTCCRHFFHVSKLSFRLPVLCQQNSFVATTGFCDFKCTSLLFARQ